METFLKDYLVVVLHLQTLTNVKFYDFVSYRYPGPFRTAYVKVAIGNREFIGEGRTRKDARQDAAAKALKSFEEDPLPAREEPVSSFQSKNKINRFFFLIYIYLIMHLGSFSVLDCPEMTLVKILSINCQPALAKK